MNPYKTNGTTDERNIFSSRKLQQISQHGIKASMYMIGQHEQHDPQLLFGHCIVCPTMYGFCLDIALSVLRYTAFAWTLHCLSYDVRLLFGHCIVCPTMYGV
jgi:hypothetical protein